MDVDNLESIRQAAESILWLATIGPEGPSGESLEMKNQSIGNNTVLANYLVFKYGSMKPNFAIVIV